MGRFVAGNCPELDRLVDEACAEIGREIAALAIPRLAGVVLGGGYGRGEGGAKQLEDGTVVLSNDLDFFAITEDGAPEAESVAAIGEELKPVAEKWTKQLGVDVDFAVKTPWRIKHDESRLMVQELVRGYFDVTGKKGEELFSGIAKIDASTLPWMEAVRLMMNRGMGLLLALEAFRSHEFIARNINKCILGAGEALLVLRRAYCWRANERVAALAATGDDGLYAAAVEWKFRPKAAPVCDWERARTRWLEAYDELCRGGRSGGKSVRSALRWLVRRHSLGDLTTFGLAPEERVLRRVAAAVRARKRVTSGLRSDWLVFN